MSQCIRCGKSSVSEKVCPVCEGKGQVMSIGVYRPIPCWECKGSGKLAYCEEHKGMKT